MPQAEENRFGPNWVPNRYKAWLNRFDLGKAKLVKPKLNRYWFVLVSQYSSKYQLLCSSTTDECISNYDVRKGISGCIMQWILQPLRKYSSQLYTWTVFRVNWCFAFPSPVLSVRIFLASILHLLCSALKPIDMHALQPSQAISHGRDGDPIK